MIANSQKFEGVFVAWMGIVDEEQGALGYQFLLPGTECTMDRARMAGTMTYVKDTEGGGVWGFRPEPWVLEDEMFSQAIARNWAKFQQNIRDWNKGIRGEN
jgi:hypothetical protein